MRLAEPVAAPWKAELSLGFQFKNSRTVLAERRADGPLIVQKPLYPEGGEVCHAIVVHPPGGVAGGDELRLSTRVSLSSRALLTTPGAGKWYRSAGPWAGQQLAFEVEGALEWLPRETIIFSGARAVLGCRVELGARARYIGWEITCLGRTGSGERFDRGEARIETVVNREGRPLLVERGRIEAGGLLMRSAAGLRGRTTFGTLLAASPSMEGTVLPALRAEMPDSVAMTLLPGLLVARYLGDSSEEAFQAFSTLWAKLRPALLGRPAHAPRIWST